MSTISDINPVNVNTLNNLKMFYTREAGIIVTNNSFEIASCFNGSLHYLRFKYKLIIQQNRLQSADTDCMWHYTMVPYNTVKDLGIFYYMSLYTVKVNFA